MHNNSQIKALVFKNIWKLAYKEKLFQSKYIFRKIGKFRRGSQGNHPTATDNYWYNIYKV